MQPPEIRAVAFDFTGVIFDARDDFVYTPMQLDIAQTFGFIERDADFVSFFAVKYGFPEAEMAAVVRELISQLYVLREPDMFARLPRLKYAWATNHLEMMVAYFKTLPIARHFCTGVSSGELGFGKPKPEFFLELANRLQEAPEHILFVDDTAANCQGAQAVGFQVEQFPVGACLSQIVLNALGASK